ncbi:MAG: DUF5658 family protein [Nitrosomonas sp.]|nr:MAG: DUF5658 family protein [Nitrosomonas sp.]
MSNAHTILNNRCQDRRREMPFFCLYHLGIKPGKRLAERRAIEHGSPNYADRYTGHLLVCAIAILLLSITDACLTLNILANGGEEVNWFMAILIEDSIEKFLAVKLALTVLPLLLLTIHHNVRITDMIRVRHLKYLILIGYSLLIGYELLLLNVAMANL